MDNEQKPPRFLHALMGGALAGTAVDLLFFPIDTVKTRLQASQGFIKAGGFRGVYRGIGSVVVGSSPGAAAFFSTYETMKHNLPLTGPLNHVVSASVGEVAACLIRVPTEVIKSRTQTLLNPSSFSALSHVLKTDGITGLYRGFAITIMREIPFTSIQFPIYEMLKSYILSNEQKKTRNLSMPQAALCGSTAGAIAAAVTTPLDVLKTRVMLQKPEEPRPTLSSIFRQGGVKGVFAGIVPRTLWIGAGGAVFLGVYEFAVGILQ
ncbi:mitochondrial carrier domain-containing protein [Mycena floridula]|nr:mitochondrial carrier domain-containing protein [Mycena floridula]